MADWQIALETSGRQGSVALLRQDVTVRQVVLGQTSRTAQALAPTLDFLLEELRRQKGQLGLVSVAVGPGSFTGLRIGVTAAKTLAFALGCPVAGLDTLAVLVSQVRRHGSLTKGPPTGTASHPWIDAAIEAYRGQVFWRRETWETSPSSQPADPARTAGVLAESQAIDAAAWFAELRKASSRQAVIATGNIWRDADDKDLPCTLADASLWLPTASEVGHLGWQMMTAGRVRSALEIMPNYLRESAAVEKRNANPQTT